MTEALAATDPAGHLPAEVTSFVGRRFERSTVRELLADFRLVTLTGFGGIGKTRLAMRMAAELRRAHPDGVCFVALGSLEEAEEVPDQVAVSLGLTGRSATSSQVAIIDYLRERTMLLVLDNCEHVVDAAAMLAETVLRSCPTVRILATSREPLRVDGEVAHAVTPLSLPGGAGPGLQESEAVQLFLDRARASAPGFTVNDDNRAAVASICRKLEGIPLALELAAARLTTLSAIELEQGLTDRWELLSRGRRTAPHRHTTMAACIEWSFDLCTPAERRVWARVAVFVDGFEYDAAQAVCAEADDAEPLLETLASLVDKSVLSASHEGAVTRFGMLPPLRQRGLAELDRLGESEELRRRHRDFHLDLVARAHADWLGARQRDWIDRLRREVGNIAEAFDRCVDDPAAVAGGLRACGQLLEYVHVLGLFHQGRRWVDRLLAAGSGDAEARTLALRAAVCWATIQGDLAAARLLLAEGRELASGGELAMHMAQVAGLLAQYVGDLEEAERLLGEAGAAFTGAGDDTEAAHCWMLLTITAVLREQPERALECHRACLALTEPVGETWVRSWSLWAAGLAEWDRGDTVTAQRMLEECLRLEEAMAERFGIGCALTALAWTLADAEPERAVLLMGAAQNEWDRVGAAIDLLPGFGERHREAEATARARLGAEGFEQALTRGRALDQSAAIAVCLREEAPPAVAAVPSAKSPLTRRERQIADLIHQGLTNRQIADSLVISPRTAEGHVEHILAKLGFTSRAQVAAWVAEQQLS